MNPVVIKLGFFALDQIAKWVETYQAAKANPGMTDAEAAALIAKVQGEAKTTADAWDDFRKGGG
jgi:hypothetical protein